MSDEGMSRFPAQFVIYFFKPSVGYDYNDQFAIKHKTGLETGLS